jgi:hypothetical protein
MLGDMLWSGFHGISQIALRISVLTCRETGIFTLGPHGAPSTSE